MTESTEPRLGPIQLLIVGFPPEAEFRGELRRAFSEVRGRGVIRVIDALFVQKAADGTISASVRESDLTLAERERMGAVVGGLLGLLAGGDEESEALGATLAAQAISQNAFGFGLGDLQNVKDEIPPGTSALVLLIEHQWALGLKAAVRGLGGVPLVQGFLTPEALFMVGAEMRAVAEAEDTIAVAQAIEGAALLSAMASVQAAEVIQQAAVAETARVLIAAGLIEAEATTEVIETLVAAELIKQEALEEARQVVEQANAEVAAIKAAQSGTNGALPPSETVPVGSEKA